jgi:hypothetical protein
MKNNKGREELNTMKNTMKTENNSSQNQQNQNQNTNMCCGGGTCCGCGWHGGHRFGLGFMILRCLLLIIILGAVFVFGVKIGELKGAFEYGGGYPMMMRGGWGGGMMGGYPQGYNQSAPMMPATTSTAK